MIVAHLASGILPPRSTVCWVAALHTLVPQVKRLQQLI